MLPLLRRTSVTARHSQRGYTQAGQDVSVHAIAVWLENIWLGDGAVVKAD